jgi:ABC-type cobalamin/Fe3+-siderophores transport system ATPase subunit
MKLRSITIIGTYKSIIGTEENPFVYDFKKNKSGYSPLCLVGLNGSGKSNLIELIADIFCYTERFFNNQYNCKDDLGYEFRLIYELNRNNQCESVLLRSNKGRPEIFTNGQLTITPEDGDGFDPFDSNIAEYFPDNIVAYSSGHNQGLSSVFSKNQLCFFNVLQKQATFYKNYDKSFGLIAGRETEFDEKIRQDICEYMAKTQHDYPSLFEEPFDMDEGYDSDQPLTSIIPSLPLGLYSEHSTNQLIFISLFISGHQKFKDFLNNELNIESLTYFELDLRLADYRGIDSIGDEVKRLVALSSSSERFSDDTYNGVLTFKVDHHFYEQFESLYSDRSIFFEKLLFLTLLAAKRWSPDEKRTLRLSKFERNVANISGGYSPLRITNTKIKLLKPNVETLYDRLSDGEHQLIQIIAALTLFEDKQTLFILDEPESHFNPEWRIEFINLISQYVKSDNTEIMISTHSPFILSACASERVLHFDKNEMGNVLIGSVDLETYGASFDTLLTSVFDLDVLISKKPLQEIRSILNEYDTEAINDEAALDKLEPFGDSFELNFRRNKIRNKIAAKTLDDGQGDR